MPDNSKGFSRFWLELKRRKVLRSLAIYAGTAFIILEASTIIFPRWGFPDWTIDLVLWLLVLGAVVNVFVAWVFDLTPQGIRKTKSMEEVDENEGRSDSKGWKAATYLSLMAIVALIVLNVVGGPKQLRAGDIQSMVILPFDNFTGDDQLEYFVDGMHASLIIDMGQVGGLQVKSRTSSSAFKDEDMTIPEIASELGVDAALETAVMCLGDTICMQFRLVSTAGDEEQLWVGEYREEKSQILNLYNRITKQIAEEVLVELTSSEEELLTESQTVNPDAYDAYLKGLYNSYQFTPEGVQLAWEYFQRAIDLDPEWADPYAGMALNWMIVGYFGMVPMEMASPKIIFYLDDALKLDPNSAYAHYVKAVHTVWGEWDWEKGEEEFLRSLELNPNNALCRMYYAHFLIGQRRHDEAIDQANLGLELDPLDPVALGLYGVVMMDVGDYPSAILQLEKAISINPDFHFPKFQLVRAYRWSGQYDLWIELWKQITCWDMEHKLAVENSLNEEGYVAAVTTLLHVSKEYGNPGCQMKDKTRIMWLIQAGKYDHAMALMEKLDEQGKIDVAFMASNHEGYEHLKSYPGYVALLQKYKLPYPKD
jgi:TolB-like protein